MACELRWPVPAWLCSQLARAQPSVEGGQLFRRAWIHPARAPPAHRPAPSRLLRCRRAAALADGNEAQTASAEPAAPWRQNDLPALSGGRVLRRGWHAHPRRARHGRPGHHRGRGLRPGRAVCLRRPDRPARLRTDHHDGAAVPGGLPTVHKRHFAADGSGLISTRRTGTG